MGLSGTHVGNKNLLGQCLSLMNLKISGVDEISIKTVDAVNTHVPVDYDSQSGKEEPRSGSSKRMKSNSYKKLYEANLARYKEFMNAALKSEKESKEKIKLKLGGFKPQSGLEGVSLMKSSLDEASQNVAFQDNIASPMYVVDSEMDPTRMLQDSNDAMLENFFSRPLKIAEYQWDTSAALAQEFNPWLLYFSNARVNARLQNFNLLRCKLHLKVVVNGSGFQYGRAVLAYNPLDVFDDLSTHDSTEPADLVHTTQLPHVYLDPTTSQGGEMILPFFYHKNYLNIPDRDWEDMGLCYLRSINTLKHANGATDKVTVNVYAWAEEVSMSVLTNQGYTPQSGQEVDEANERGFISGPASVVSKAAKTMTGISAIAPFAMATSKAADVIGGAAKMFGYCAPLVTKAPESYKPLVSGSLATTNTPQTAAKLTLDDKQELSIDPRIAGLSGDDPLIIRDIAARESYLTKFPWTIGSAPETLLWNSRISPVTWAETASDPPGYLFPPCAMAAMPFKYWTGSMKFRFQVVCSSFHKGRLRVSYEPNFVTTPEYNTNYTRIVDISKEQDFTIEVGNGQEYTLLDHLQPGPDTQDDCYSTTRFASKAQGNGVLSVYIVNELTTPNSTVNNDIEINVFVSMGEDFEVFVPDSSVITKFVFKPQSGKEGVPQVIPESQGTKEPSAPQHVLTHRIGPTDQDLSNINKVYTGESIASFRPLLKRWALHETTQMEEGRGVAVGIRCMVPFLRGNVANAVHTTSAANNYSYCNTLLYHWVRYAFQGQRGSMRWRVIPRASTSASNSHSIYLQRNPLGVGSEYFGVNSVLGVSPNESTGAYRTVQDGIQSLPIVTFPASALDGVFYTNNVVNDVSEIEIPWYNSHRFSPGKTESLTGVETFDPTWRFSLLSFVSTAKNLDLWVSTGEDFQTYMWTGLPRMYFEDSPPLPEF